MTTDNENAVRVKQIEGAIRGTNKRFDDQIHYHDTAVLIDEVAGHLGLPVEVMTAAPWRICGGIDSRIVKNNGMPDEQSIGEGKHRGIATSFHGKARLDIFVSAVPRSSKRVVVVRYSNGDHQLVASRVTFTGKPRETVVELLELRKDRKAQRSEEGPKINRNSYDSGDAIDRAFMSVKTKDTFEAFLDVIHETAIADSQPT